MVAQLMRSFFVLAALFLLLVARPVLAVDTFVPTQLCSVLGATHMSADHSGLVICGRTTGDSADVCTDNGCTWKLMSGGGSACYDDYALPPGQLVGNPCTVSGFTVKGNLDRFLHLRWQYGSQLLVFPPGGREMRGGVRKSRFGRGRERLSLL
jgi:hypothetical protein